MDPPLGPIWNVRQITVFQAKNDCALTLDIGMDATSGKRNPYRYFGLPVKMLRNWNEWRKMVEFRNETKQSLFLFITVDLWSYINA